MLKRLTTQNAGKLQMQRWDEDQVTASNLQSKFYTYINISDNLSKNQEYEDSIPSHSVHKVTEETHDWVLFTA